MQPRLAALARCFGVCIRARASRAQQIPATPTPTPAPPRRMFR